MEAILAEEREEGGDPLFQRIDHYAPYKPFAFDYFIFPIMLLGYSIIAWLLRDYNESYSGLVWLGATVLGLASIFFAKQSYDNYSKSRNLGGWLLTDTGMLLIEPGAKIAYKFAPYGPMLSFLWDGTGEKEIFMLSEASPFDKIKASDMASEEVFDDFVRNLQYKQIDAEEL